MPFRLLSTDFEPYNVVDPKPDVPRDQRRNGSTGSDLSRDRGTASPLPTQAADQASPQASSNVRSTFRLSDTNFNVLVPAQGAVKPRVRGVINRGGEFEGGAVQPRTPADFTKIAPVTTLGDDDELYYQDWMQRIGHTRDRGMAVDDNFTGTNYDYRGFFKKYGDVDVAEGQHFTDEFKLPSHPTFSDESIYAKGDAARLAGRWEGETFIPPGTEQPESDWGTVLANTVASLPARFKAQIAGVRMQTAGAAQRGESMFTVPEPKEESGSVEEIQRRRELRRGIRERFIERYGDAAEIEHAAEIDFLEAQSRLQELKPNVKEGSAKYYAAAIIDATLNMAPAVALAFVNRGAGAALMGTQAFGDQYAESLLAKGRTRNEATVDALFNAAAETLTEMVPLGILTKIKAGEKVLPRILKATLAEGTQEALMGAIEYGYETGVIDPDTEFSWGELLRRVRDSAIIGAGAGGGLSIATAPVYSVLQRAQPEQIEEAIEEGKSIDEIATDIQTRLDTIAEAPPDLEEIEEPTPPKGPASLEQRRTNLQSLIEQSEDENVTALLRSELAQVDSQIAGGTPKPMSREQRLRRSRTPLPTDTADIVIRKLGGLDTSIENDFKERLHGSPLDVAGGGKGQRTIEGFVVGGLERKGSGVTIGRLTENLWELGFIPENDESLTHDILSRIEQGEVIVNPRSAAAIEEEGLRLERDREDPLEFEEEMDAAASVEQLTSQLAELDEGEAERISKQELPERETATLLRDAITRLGGQPQMPMAHRSQIGTPEFKNWFGESKVVDEQGAPRQMYHGTTNARAIREFKRGKNKWGGEDIGLHFGTNSQAQSRLEDARKEGRKGSQSVIPVYLSIKNPLRMEDVGNWKSPTSVAAGLPTKELRDKARRAIEPWIHTSSEDGTMEALRKVLQDAGYDGIVYTNRYEFEDAADMKARIRELERTVEKVRRRDESSDMLDELEEELSDARQNLDDATDEAQDDSWIAFEPTQIKSAVGNRGTFDPKSPNIMAHRAPKFPLAERDEWYSDADYEARGGRMTQMTPDEFLAKATPLKIDESDRETIDDLKKHIQSGKGLTPLAIYKTERSIRNQDGRHRAIAAKELGIKEVPVLDFTSPDVTETAAFKNWFGKSQVVDEDGKPLVVRHGGKFNEKVSPIFRTPHEGVFFTDNPELAKGYAKYGQITEAYLKIENPFRPEKLDDVKPPSWVMDWIKFWRGEDGWTDRTTGEEMSNHDVLQAISNVELYHYEGTGNGQRWKDFLATAKDHHDGFIGVDPTEGGAKIFVVFDQKQIKSATGNKGTFDPDSADILAHREEIPEFPLSALHNVSEEGLIHADKLGGFAMPSIAVVPGKGGSMEGFGSVTLIGTKDLVDPEKEPVFDADAYTQRIPRAKWPKARTAVVQKVVDEFRPFAAKFDTEYVKDNLWDNAVNNPKPEETISELTRPLEAGVAWFLKKVHNTEFEPVTKKYEPQRFGFVNTKAFREYVKSGGDLDPSSGESEGRKNFTRAVKAAVAEYRKDTYESLEPEMREYLEKATNEELFDEDTGLVRFGLIWQISKEASKLDTKIVDYDKTRKRMTQLLKGKESEYQSWVHDKIMKMHGPPYVQVGRKKLPYTLVNIVESMKRTRKLAGAEDTMTFGEGSARAHASKRFTSLQWMRNAAEHQIKSEREVSEARDKAKELIEKYRDDILPYYEYQQDTWGGLDASMRAIAKWGRNRLRRGSASVMRDALRSEGFKSVPNYLIDEAVEAATAFMDAPVPYFEAKPQRIVGLEEFVGAVIPEKAKPETIALLKKQGIPYKTYPPSVDGATRAAIVDAFRKELSDQGVRSLFHRKPKEPKKRRQLSPTEKAAKERWNKKKHAATIRAEIDQMVPKRSGFPPTVVVESWSQIPQRIRAALQDDGTVTGLFDPTPGSTAVYLVADRMTTHGPAKEVWLHEMVGHYGTRMIVGAQYGEIMEAVAQAFPAAVRRRAKQHGYDFRIERERHLAAEEHIAYTAQKVLTGQDVSSRERSLLDRVLDAIRDALRYVFGIQTKFTEKQLLGLIQQAANYVWSPAGAMTEAATMNAGFRRHEVAPVYYSQIYRALLDPKTVPETSTIGEYKRIIANKVAKGEIKQAEVQWTGIIDRLDYLLDKEAQKATPAAFADVLMQNKKILPQHIQDALVPKADEGDLVGIIEDMMSSGDLLRSLDMSKLRVSRDWILELVRANEVAIEVVPPKSDEESLNVFDSVRYENGEYVDPEPEYVQGQADDMFEQSELESRVEAAIEENGEDRIDDPNDAEERAEVEGEIRAEVEEEYRKELLDRAWEDANEFRPLQWHDGDYEIWLDNPYEQEKYHSYNVIYKNEHIAGELSDFSDAKAAADKHYKSLFGDVRPEFSRWDQYVLPGGKNYRERLFIWKAGGNVPNEVSVGNMSAHFGDDTNFIVHARFDERETADGKKAIFVDELQSDWHQFNRDQQKNAEQQKRQADRARERLLELEPLLKEANAHANKIALEAVEALGEDVFRKQLYGVMGVSAEAKYKTMSLKEIVESATSPEVISHIITDIIGVYDSARGYSRRMAYLTSPTFREAYEPERKRIVADHKGLDDGFGPAWREWVIRTVEVTHLTETQVEIDKEILDSELHKKSRELIASIVKYKEHDLHIKEANQIIRNYDEPKTVPAPFEDTYMVLVAKWMIQEAVRNNFDRVLFAPGSMHSARWHALKSLDHLRFSPLYPDTVSIEKVQPYGGQVGEITKDNLGDYVHLRDVDVVSKAKLKYLIGSKAASYVLERVNKGEPGTVDPNQLGSPIWFSNGIPDSRATQIHMGSLAIYDEIYVNKINRFLKPYKAKIVHGRMGGFFSQMVAEENGLEFWKQGAKGGAMVWELEITPELKAAAQNDGFPLFHRRDLEEHVMQHRAILSGNTWDVDEGSRTQRWWNYLVFQMQNRFESVFRSQKAIEQYVGAPIPDDLDAYLKEEMYHSRVKYRIDDYDKQWVEPLVKSIKDSGYSWDDVEMYLYARHAPEANARLAKINKDPRFNSGMTDAEAADIIRILTGQGDIAKLQAIGAYIDRMTKLHRDTLVSEGLEVQDTIDAWEATYQHYVPLKGDPNATDGMLPAKGRGFDVGGPATKARLGRRSRASSILANVVAAQQATFIRAEKARVGRALLGLATQFQNPKIWTVDQVKLKRYIDKRTGLVSRMVDPMYKFADNVLRVKVAGVDHTITFNERSTTAMRMVQAMKNLSAADAGLLIQGLHSLNRMLSSLNTSLNPEFVVSNLIRDLQTAFINLSATDAEKSKTKIMRGVAPAMRGIYRNLFKDDVTSTWAKHFDDFKKVGGQVGWIDHYKDITDLNRKLRRQLKSLDNKFVSWNTVKAAIETVEKFNQVVENAVRLSAFVEARRLGMTDERAASLAKNLTVNFNRKGNQAVVANALYLFYNASIQGTTVIWQAAKSPKARQWMYGIVAFAALMDVVMRMVGGQDDDGEWVYDNIDDTVKERNMIIMLPPSLLKDDPKSLEDYYFKIPLPYGYNVLHTIGRKAGSYMDYSLIGNKRSIDPIEDAMVILLSAAHSFNPIGTEAGIAQTLSPTIMDPILQIEQNKAWHGGPIVPEVDPFDIAPSPKSERYFRTVSEPSKWLARKMNELGGGTESRPSAIPILDNSPETLDHIQEFVTGGLGRFITNMTELALKAGKPEEIEPERIPFVRRVLGSTGSYEVRDRYYEHTREIEYADRELEAAIENKDRARQQRLWQDYGAELRMRGQARSTQAFLKRQRTMRRAAEESDLLLDDEKEKRVKEIEDRMDQRMNDFNRNFNEAKDRAREGRSGVARAVPFINGRSLEEAVVALREGGLKDTADLLASLPKRPRKAAVAEMEKALA